MKRCSRRAAALLAALGALGACAPKGPTATVYRDEFGVPHIYSESAEAGLYASGWAMAEDRLEQTLENFLRGMGRYASAFGAGENNVNYRADLQALMWDHYGAARQHFETKLNPELQGHLVAFVAGINAYMEEHPEEVPDWWGDREVDVYMPVAFSRQFIWGWPAGQAAADLRAIGLEPNYSTDARASNEIALAPSRTDFGAAALIIDPHLSWFGRQRYWEIRLHAGDIHISGFATAGFPYVNLGHNQNIAWAHTTGGPDTADIFELTLDEEGGSRYLYDGGMRPLLPRRVEIPVKGESSPRQRMLWYSHHGPIVARQGDKAYAAALAYADEIGYLESKYWFMVAEDYEGAIKALEVRQIMPQNVMVADTAGNIYYQRTGRVPIRPEGYDYSRPVDGSTSATGWQGIHPVEDLMSLLNPESGYMQNCNITPDVMFVGSPLTADRWTSYLFGQPPWTTHQRGSRAVDILEGQETFSLDDVLHLALDKRVYQVERWQEALQEANERRRGRGTEDYRVGLEGILAWDGEARRDSSGALQYYYWRHALTELVSDERLESLIAKVNDYLEPFDSAPPRDRQPLTQSDYDLLVLSLEAGMVTMKVRHGSLDAVFGDVFRVGRLDAEDDVSWPVGGGSLRREGMATLRAIGFGPEREDHTRWGRSGQTSTQVVILSDPIKSFTQPPIGQSDRPDSPHYRDQAEKLFSRSEMKPSWFDRAELLDGHVRSSYELVYVAEPPEEGAEETPEETPEEETGH